MNVRFIMCYTVHDKERPEPGAFAILRARARLHACAKL